MVMKIEDYRKPDGTICGVIMLSKDELIHLLRKQTLQIENKFIYDEGHPISIKLEYYDD